MTKEEIYSAWSPDDSVWSTWVKPVLFAHVRTESPSPPPRQPSNQVDWAPSVRERYSMVLDLPGEDGVWIGVALSRRGYRPVPLYNALPMPYPERSLDTAPTDAVAAVEVYPIIAALRDSAEYLGSVNLPTDAPPAFLLDSNRQGANFAVLPDQFDNRSVCFTTDFPSASFLQAHGIERVLLIQRGGTEPQEDLAHVLRRWQDGGMSLERLCIEQGLERSPFQVTRPRWYGAMFQRALAALGLRRAPRGGFGAWIPESPSGG